MILATGSDRDVILNCPNPRFGTSPGRDAGSRTLLRRSATSVPSEEVSVAQRGRLEGQRAERATDAITSTSSARINDALPDGSSDKTPSHARAVIVVCRAAWRSVEVGCPRLWWPTGVADVIGQSRIG